MLDPVLRYGEDQVSRSERELLDRCERSINGHFGEQLAWAEDAEMTTGADCTRCGMCLDVCPTQALSFEVKGLSKLV